jgi:hypothetical protein
MQEAGGVVAGHGNQTKVGDGRDEAAGQLGGGKRLPEILDLCGLVNMEAGAV